jgi:hypothetical protein
MRRYAVHLQPEEREQLLRMTRSGRAPFFYSILMRNFGKVGATPFSPFFIQRIQERLR